MKFVAWIPNASLFLPPQAAQNILKAEYKEGCEVSDAIKLVLRVMTKTMDSTTLSADKLEVSTLTRDENNKVVYKIFEEAELKTLLEAVSAEIQAAKEAKEREKGASS